MLKFSVGESFTVALITGIGKVWITEGGYQKLPSKIFCLTVPKNFVGEHYRISLFSGIEKFMLQIVMSIFSTFSRNSLSHSAEKFRR